MSTELYLPPVHSTEYKKAAAFARMDHASKYVTFDGRRRANNARKKAVDAYDMEGRYLATYESVTEAAEKLHILIGGIGNCLAKRYHYTKGYQFRYHSKRHTRIKPAPPKGKPNFRDYRPERPNHKLCIVTCPDGRELQFDAIRDAAAFLGCSYGHASYMYRKGKPFAGKYYIKKAKQ